MSLISAGSISLDSTFNGCVDKSTRLFLPEGIHFASVSCRGWRGQLWNHIILDHPLVGLACRRIKMNLVFFRTFAKFVFNDVFFYQPFNLPFCWLYIMPVWDLGLKIWTKHHLAHFLTTICAILHPKTTVKCCISPIYIKQQRNFFDNFWQAGVYYME